MVLEGRMHDLKFMHFVDAKGILSPQNGMNIYRGCTHGCIYCDSRSTCYGFTHAFEDVEVKQNAPELLEKALRSKRKKCMIGTGAMCDPYMHCEETLQLTRKCLELIARYEFGATVHTKSDRVLRDLDLLKRIHEKAKCVVQMTLTTYDESLCKILEPNVCTTRRRAEVLEILRDNGIPTIAGGGQGIFLRGAGTAFSGAVAEVPSEIRICLRTGKRQKSGTDAFVS